MKVLIIILNNTDILDDVLLLFVKHEVKGATILDSQGMASSIVNNDITDIPIFGSLKTLLKGNHPYNKTIFTVIKEEEKLKRVVSALQKMLKNEQDQDGGFMFTIPVDDICC